MKFGLGSSKKITGSHLSLYIFQFVSVLPAIYILVASGFMALLSMDGIVPFLCLTVFSIIPRAESIGLSYLYRLTSGEAFVCMGLLLSALIVGLILNKLLRSKEKTAFIVRIIYAVFLAADLILRLLPFSFNKAFGFAPDAIGFAVTLICLALVAADIIVYKTHVNNS